MRKSSQSFIHTVNTVAQAAGCDPGTIRRYSDQGLIEVFRLANGVRLFRTDASKKVAELLASRSTRPKTVAA